MTKLDSLLERAVDKGVFGTKMRSFIQEPNDDGIKAIVDQQFDYADKIAGPRTDADHRAEVSNQKSRQNQGGQPAWCRPLRTKLDELLDDRQVHAQADVAQRRQPLCLADRPSAGNAGGRLVGGYSLTESCAILARNHRLIASFSRALTEGLTADQTDAEFDAKLIQYRRDSTRPR